MVARQGRAGRRLVEGDEGTGHGGDEGEDGQQRDQFAGGFESEAHQAADPYSARIAASAAEAL